MASVGELEQDLVPLAIGGVSPLVGDGDLDLVETVDVLGYKTVLVPHRDNHRVVTIV